METDTIERRADRASDPPTDSFEEFYAGTADRVYRALAVTLADIHLAREAADEAMARAFVHWSKVARYDNPGGWVFRVGLNWATSWRRKLRRERALTDDSWPAAPAMDTGGLAASAALARLPVAQRAVVVCRVLFTLSTAETAAVLRIAEGTVRSRLSRAIAALRRDLGATKLREEER